MKKVFIIAIGIIVVAGLVVALKYAPNATTNAPAVQTLQTSQTPQSSETASDLPLELAAGRYEQYDAEKVAAAGYTRTVLFFHAPWCPECRAFEQVIKEEAIPTGTQILKVDYDSATDLRQKYAVTIQSTFVSVASDGSQTGKWVGYGKDKTLNAILENS